MLKQGRKSLRKLPVTTLDSNYKNAASRKRVSPLAIGALAILISLIFVPIILEMLKSGNDYPMHIWWASYWDKTGMVTAPLPHFLYQVVLIGVEHILPGGSFAFAAAFVGVVCYVSVGIVLFTIIYPLFGAGSESVRTLAAILVSLVLLLVGPINLFTWSGNNLLYGYIPTNVYHNPTIVLLKPFALLLFLHGLRIFSTSHPSRLILISTAAVTVLGTIAKPNYVIAFIPALVLCVGFAFIRKQQINWALLLIGIFLPACEILLWQLNYVRGSSLGGFIFAPFQVMQGYSPHNLLPKFILSILFPSTVIVIYWRYAREDIGLRLAWISFAVGAFYTYFLSESQNYASGNFTWSGQITLFILFVATTMFLIRHNRDFLSQKRLNLRLGLSLIFLLLHLLGGVALYLAHLNSNWRMFL